MNRTTGWHGRRQIRVILAVAAACIPGCAADSMPATYSVKGTVVYKGANRPLTGGTVLLESVSEPKVRASGEIQPDGSFELASDLGKPGTVAGEHRVLIQPPFQEDGQKPVVNRRFTSFSTSGLKATVSPRAANDLRLEVDP